MHDDQIPFRKPPVDLSNVDTASLARLEPDHLIADRYRVLNLLARGGMGSVYKVEQVFLHKEFALKTLDPTQMSDLSWQRFQKEARAASQLEHPNLVKVHDFGMVKEGQPYFVMDLVVGHTLRQLMESNGVLNLEDALDIFKQVAAGLSYAHKKGLVHRDIKPSNIMLATRDLLGIEKDVKILDFGIAKHMNGIGEDAPTLTRTGEVFGTPYYMSPEQCMGIALDHRSDLYSLGCVMFEMLVGTTPFVGDSPLAVMLKHQSQLAPTLREASLGGDFSPAVETVVAKLLAKDPRMRYQSAESLIIDLEKLEKNQPISINSTMQFTPQKKRYGKFILAAAIAASALCCGVALFLVGRMTAPSQAPAAAPVFKQLDDENVSKQLLELPDRHEITEKLPKYFSSMAPDQTSTRFFHFPTKLSVGYIVSADPNTKFFDSDGKPLTGNISATGSILAEHFHPFGFRPNNDAIRDVPDFLSHFRPDEVDALDIKNVALASTDTVKGIRDFRVLKILSLFGDEYINGSAVEYIRSPELQRLNLDGARGIHADDLLRLPTLLNLDHLSMRGHDPVNKLLNRLRETSALHYLGVRRCELDAQAIDSIAHISNLNTLDISANNVLLENLWRLKPLKKLERLCIQDLRLSKDSVLDLVKSLPKLKMLEVTTDSWTASDRDELIRALPNCRIFNNYQSYIERPNNVIHDPYPDQPADENL